MMSDDERDRLAEAKTFAWAAPTMLPLVRKRRDTALALLLSEFRQGRTDNLARIAELNAFALIEMEITQKQNEYQTLEEHYANPKRK